jgi:flagellar hook-length control protein FliK
VAARAASLLPQLLAAIPTSSDSSSVSRSINVPVSDPSWPQALAAQVQWMLGSQVQSATLRLSPAHLGPIQIRIDLQQSQINVSFSAAHADTRSALAEAIPRLREMLASGGLTLGQTNVQQEAPGGGQARSQGTSPGESSADAGQTVEPVALAQTWALGLVDEYA